MTCVHAGCAWVTEVNYNPPVGGAPFGACHDWANLCPRVERWPVEGAEQCPESHFLPHVSSDVIGVVDHLVVVGDGRYGWPGGAV